MIEIEKVFFCDNIEYGQYYKLNIIGLIPTKIIAFNVFPYKFITYLGIIGKIESEQEKFSLNVYTKNVDNNIIYEDRVPSEVLHNKEIPISCLFFHFFPLTLYIYEPGSIGIQIISDDIIIYGEEYTVVTGDAPNSNIVKHMPHSGTFGALANNMDMDHIIELLSSATHSLRIIDRFIDSDEFVNLLKSIDKGVRVQILTGNLSKERLRELKAHFKDIEIKKSNDFHDRYLKIYNSEYYHFGHSSKDLKKGKTSSFTKICNKAEIEIFEKTFNAIWNKDFE